MTTEERGSQWDEFVQARWAACQIIMQEAEVVEGVMHSLSEGQPAFGVLVAQSILHVAEEAPGARDGKRHGP
jgi:hypothetical protein